GRPASAAFPPRNAAGLGLWAGAAAAFPAGAFHQPLAVAGGAGALRAVVLENLARAAGPAAGCAAGGVADAGQDPQPLGDADLFPSPPPGRRHAYYRV